MCCQPQMSRRLWSYWNCIVGWYHGFGKQYESFLLGKHTSTLWSNISSKRMRTYGYKRAWTLVSTVALFIITPHWIQPKCPSTGGWINNEHRQHHGWSLKTLCWAYKSTYCVISYVSFRRGKSNIWWNKSEYWMLGGEGWTGMGPGVYGGDENGLS